MSLFPTLEIGLWNAWLLVFHPLLFPIIMIVMYKADIGDMWKKMGEVSYENGEKRIFMISIVVMLLHENQSANRTIETGGIPP